MRWRYTVLEALNAKELEQQLNGFLNQGYELVSILHLAESLHAYAYTLIVRTPI